MPISQAQVEKQRSAFRVSNRETWLVVVATVAFSLFYFLDIYLRSSEKYFWYDELFTSFLCKMSFPSLWTAVKAGADQNPPLFYLLTKASTAILGHGRLATRLPEITGFWIFCLCLFRFVTRRAGVVVGFVVMFFPVFTGAFYYAYEARPHGIVLGFCGLALVCWQMMIEHRERNTWNVAFSLCLLGAFLTHCYAITLTVPFGVAQMVESIRSRHVRWKGWLAIALPASIACLTYIPLLRSAHLMGDGSQVLAIAPHNWSRVLAFYVFLLSPSLLLLITALALGTVVKFLENRAERPEGRDESELRILEFVLAAAFLALPVFGVILAKLVNTNVVSRYFLSALAGVCILLGFFLQSAKRMHWATCTLACIMAMTALGSVSLVFRHRRHGVLEPLADPSSNFTMNASLTGPMGRYSWLLSHVRPGEPIFLPWEADVVYFSNYAPDVAPRTYYIQWNETDVFGRFLRTLQHWYPVHYNVARPDEFFHSTPEFAVIGPDWATFTLGRFIRAGGTITSFDVGDDRFVAQVRMNAGQAPAQ